MCSGLLTRSQKIERRSRHASAFSLSTSNRMVLSDWTMRGFSGLYNVGRRVVGSLGGGSPGTRLPQESIPPEGDGSITAQGARKQNHTVIRLSKVDALYEVTDILW